MLLAVDPASTAYHIGEFVGLGFGLILAFAVVRSALGRGLGQNPSRPRDLGIAAVAVVVAGALVISGANRGMFESGASARASADPGWSSQAGINVKAGFVAGCGHGAARQTAVCECVFARISATPPYDTPMGFEALLPVLQRFQQTLQPSVLPQALLAAARGCAAGHSA